MRQELDNLVFKLNNDSLSAITITNLSTGQVLYNNLLSNQIKEQFGTAESLFDKIHDDNFKNLKIQLRRKNGSSFKNDGQPYVIEAEKEIEIDDDGPDDEPQEHKKKKNKSHSFNGEMGSMFGMSQMDILKLHSKAEQYEKARDEVKEWKLEAKNLKEKYEAAKEEILEKKYTVEKTDSRNNMVGQIVSGLSAAVPQLVEAFGKKAVGLSAPEEIEVFSEAKTNLINQIKNTDDTLNAIFSEIITRISSKVENFELEFMQFLIVQKIVNNG